MMGRIFPPLWWPIFSPSSFFFFLPNGHFRTKDHNPLLNIHHYRHTIKARVSAWRQIYTAWKHWREKGAAGHEEDIWYSRILLWVDAQDVIGPCDPDATPLNAEWGKWEEANTAPFAPAASQTHAALVFRSPRFESARSFYFSIFIAILLELAGVER